MVKVRGLVKAYGTDSGEVRAVRGVDFEVPEGKFLTLLGPSGCGKTTTLRCVAGLEMIDEGEIEIDGQIVTSVRQGLFVPPHQRDLGMVFQSYAIWPHMTVFENVAFPLTYLKNRPSKRTMREKVQRALSLLHLDELEKRPAPQLSGGQQQRLALARAIVREPKVLLLDEPLSNLDAQLRAEMRFELKSLAKRLGITTIYVTHDQLEALTMSDEVAVMHAGKIIQVSSPRDLYRKPRNRFVASFIGTSNLFEGKVLTVDSPNQPSSVDIGIGTLHCFLPQGTRPGSELSLAVRPEHFEISLTKPAAADGTLKGKVSNLLFLGEALECYIEVEGRMIHVKAPDTVDIKDGDEVFLRVAAEHCLAVESA
jgi:iron(III) transport system ATP-binding protein